MQAHEYSVLAAIIAAAIWRAGIIDRILDATMGPARGDPRRGAPPIVGPPITGDGWVRRAHSDAPAKGRGASWAARLGAAWGRWRASR